MELGTQNLKRSLINRQVTPSSQAYSPEKDFHQGTSSSSSFSQNSQKQRQFEEGIGAQLKFGTLNIIIMAVTVLIVDFIFRQGIFEYEMQLLGNLRDQIQNPEFYNFSRGILWLTELKTVKILCIALYFFSDPMLAFKTGILTYIAIYFIVNLKFLYAIPRPFWIDHSIEVERCDLDFSGPSDHTCIGSFFYTYVILLYYYHNSEKEAADTETDESRENETTWYSRYKNFIMVSLCITMVVIIMLFTGFSLFLIGHTFMFESSIGIIYSILFALFCLKIDGQFYKYCNSTVFDIKMSRRYKFIALFICMGLLTTNVLIRQLNREDHSNSPEWIQAPCVKDSGIQYNIGGDYTFFDNCILFMIVGCIFGCSLASSKIDDFLVRDTSFCKRAIRTIIGVTLIISFQYSVEFIPVDNYLTEFLFRFGFPNLIIGYFCYGIYPLLWKYFYLMGELEDYSETESITEEDEEDIGEESNPSSDTSSRNMDRSAPIVKVEKIREVAPPIEIRNLDSSKHTSDNSSLAQKLRLNRIAKERVDHDFFDHEESHTPSSKFP